MKQHAINREHQTAFFILLDCMGRSMETPHFRQKEWGLSLPKMETFTLLRTLVRGTWKPSLPQNGMETLISANREPRFAETLGKWIMETLIVL